MRDLFSRARKTAVQLVVVGGFQGIQEPTFWRDAALRDSFVDSWRWFAATFGDEPALAGMDLMNEPNPPWPSGDIAEATSAWNPLAAAAIDAIRNERVRLPVIYEPVAGGNAIGLARMQPFGDREVVYSIHFYTPHDITHQRVAAAWQRSIPYPADVSYGLGAMDARFGITAVDRARLELDLMAAREFQRRHDVPIYVGEFSCVRWAPAGSALRYIGDALAIFNQWGWSWTYHEFRGWPGWDAEIDSTDPAAHRRSIDAPVMQALRAAMRSESR